MILIQQHDNQNNGFTLTTERGRTIEVYSGGFLNVYAGRHRLGMGRAFHGETIEERFNQAINAYRSSEIKAALQLLLSIIIAD